MNQFFLIWKRNFRGAIEACFDNFFDYDSLSTPALSLVLGGIFLGSLILVIPSLFIIPLFIGIFGGSLVKSAIDCLSRNFITDPDEILSVKQSISKMNNQQMAKLKIELTSNNYIAQSNSSWELINRISTDSEKQEELDAIERLTASSIEDSSLSRFQYVSYEGPDRGIFKDLIKVDTKNLPEKINQLKEEKESS